MAYVLALHSIAGLISLVCFILVIVRMFQHAQTMMGVACLVGVLLAAFGLVAFIYGWMKAGEWRMKDTMLTWTACIVVMIVVQIVAPNAFFEAFGFRR